MSTSAGTPEPRAAEPAEPADGASVEEIEQDIARTRAELGQTVEALAERLDVSAQAKKKVGAVKENVTGAAQSAKDSVVDAAGAARAKVSAVLGHDDESADAGPPTVATSPTVAPGTTSDSRSGTSASSATAGRHSTDPTTGARRPQDTLRDAAHAGLERSRELPVTAIGAGVGALVGLVVVLVRRR